MLRDDNEVFLFHREVYSLVWKLAVYEGGGGVGGKGDSITDIIRNKSERRQRGFPFSSRSILFGVKIGGIWRRRRSRRKRRFYQWHFWKQCWMTTFWFSFFIENYTLCCENWRYMKKKEEEEEGDAITDTMLKDDSEVFLFHREVYSLVWKLAVYEEEVGGRWMLSVTFWKDDIMVFLHLREVYSLVWKLAVYEGGGVVGGGRRCYLWHYWKQRWKTTARFCFFIEKYTLWCENWRYMKEEE